MSEHELQCYDYVNHRYSEVRDALTADALGIFQCATQVAETRARELAANATLRTSVGPIAVGADIVIRVAGVSEGTSPFHSPMTSLELEWRAARADTLFPAMRATLSLYALTKSETQLDFHGFYRPPFGAFGGIVDKALLHRIAEATVLRFVQEVAAYLRGPPPQDDVLRAALRKL